MHPRKITAKKSDAKRQDKSFPILNCGLERNAAALFFMCRELPSPCPATTQADKLREENPLEFPCNYPWFGTIETITVSFTLIHHEFISLNFLLFRRQASIREQQSLCAFTASDDQ